MGGVALVVKFCFLWALILDPRPTYAIIVLQTLSLRAAAV